MVDNSTHALSTSLLRARLGQVAVPPPTEQQLVERLCAFAEMIGCNDTDLIRAIYIGLKLRQGVCLYGVPTTHTLPLLDTFVATLVDADSEQVVRLQAPNIADPVMRRFGALRINELVLSALEPAQADKAWFLLLYGEDAGSVLAWAQRELVAATGDRRRPRGCWPNNIFVLAATTTCSGYDPRYWLPFRASTCLPAPLRTVQHAMPPVGYQRQLVRARLGGPTYLRRLRAAKHALLPYSGSLPPKLVSRWLAAAVDAQGRGLWNADNVQANAQRALAVLQALTGPAQR